MHHGIGSSRPLSAAPQAENWTTTPRRPHARGPGKPSGPRTNQIEGKKLPAFKILLLRHHPPPCGEQVVSRREWGEPSGELTGGLGIGPAGLGGGDSDLRCRTPRPRPGGVRSCSGLPARRRRRRLFTVESGPLPFPSPAGDGVRGGGGASLELDVEGVGPPERGFPCAFHGRARRGWEWGAGPPTSGDTEA